MSAQALISINDGASTPVARSLLPRGARASQTGKDLAIWRESNAIPMAALQLQELHTPAKTGGVERFKYTIELPTVLTTTDVSGASSYQKVRSVTATVEVLLPAAVSQLELDHIAALVKNFTASAYFAAAIKNRESAW